MRDPDVVQPPMTSFACKRPSALGERKRAAIAGESGNSMNVNIAGMYLLYATLFCRRADMVSFETFVSHAGQHNFGQPVVVEVDLTDRCSMFP